MVRNTLPVESPVEKSPISQSLWMWKKTKVPVHAYYHRDTLGLVGGICRAPVVFPPLPGRGRRMELTFRLGEGQRRALGADPEGLQVILVFLKLFGRRTKSTNVMGTGPECTSE